MVLKRKDIDQVDVEDVNLYVKFEERLSLYTF